MTKETLAEVLAECDQGIREVVRWLNAHGFETCDSGDGTTKRAAGYDEALDYPHVFIQVERAHTGMDVADRLARELRLDGVIVTQVGEEFAPGTPAGAWIQLTYDPVTERCFIELMHLDDAVLRAAGVVP